MSRMHPKPSDLERVTKQINDEVQDKTEQFMKARCSKPTDLELVTGRRKELMDQMKKEEFDAAQELGGNHKDSAKLVNAEEEKRTEQDSKRRRIDVLESNSIAGIVPAIEPFTARCVKRVFFQKVLSNRPKARVLFSIEQLLFIEAVTNNNNMDDVCRLLEENLNVLLQIIVYVYMF